MVDQLHNWLKAAAQGFVFRRAELELDQQRRQQERAEPELGRGAPRQVGPVEMPPRVRATGRWAGSVHPHAWRRAARGGACGMSTCDGRVYAVHRVGMLRTRERRRPETPVSPGARAWYEFVFCSIE